MEFKNILISQFKFSDLDIELTQQMFQRETVEAKNFFVKEGKVAAKLGIVVTGMFRTYYLNSDANEITTAFHEPNSLLLSVDSFNNQVKSKENTIALEKSEILTITLTNWKKLNEKVAKWRDVCLATGDYMGLRLQARAREFQTLTAKERYIKFCKNHPTVLQKATLCQIASYIGIDIATLSRIRKKL